MQRSSNKTGDISHTCRNRRSDILPYERCTRWTGGLQATGRTMLGASQRIFRAYRGRSTQSACVGLFDARSPSCAGVNQSNLDQAAAEQVGPVDLRIIGS
jgi:hypothetical protein